MLLTKWLMRQFVKAQTSLVGDSNKIHPAPSDMQIAQFGRPAQVVNDGAGSLPKAVKKGLQKPHRSWRNELQF